MRIMRCPSAGSSCARGAGQICSAGTRLFVERKIYEDFTQRVADFARSLKVGNGLDPQTQVGPLVSSEQLERVSGYLALGQKEGARALSGGARVAEGDLAQGFFVPPTVFADVSPDARIFQEEIFGPVVAITPFDTDDEALALANNTKYGLAAYVWTNDLKRAHNFAQAVEAGMVWLNSNNVRDLRTPFGGVKASGLGHEGGYRSIDFYTDQQAVHITLGKVHNPTFGKN